jgi:hypothetical protein
MYVILHVKFLDCGFTVIYTYSLIVYVILDEVPVHTPNLSV